MILDIAFCAAVALVLYAYLGYPAVLMALLLVRDRRVTKAPVLPSVSFIITAHNEERRIREKLENTLGQDYPASRLEIIVASDCSTDRTDEIVGAYPDRVRLIRAAERRGKEAAQQLAVRAAAGDILVFSDVATALAPDGISSIVGNFADASVGCVSSVDRFVDADGTLSGEGAYVRYEMFLRGLESRVNGLVGLSGSFFAARREVCRRWAADRQSDFNTLDAQRDGHGFAVVMFDLDRFKVVNDSFGHRAGDQLIKEVAQRLASVGRTTDTVARLGGDEFLIIVDTIGQREDAEEIARRAVEALQAPIRLADVDIHTSSSIGIAFYPTDGQSVETLIANADAAMYCAKQHPELVSKIITLDNLRVPFVLSDRVKILSFRSKDPNFKTDPGVLPTAEQAKAGGIDIVNTGAQHTDLSDRGPDSVKGKIQATLDQFLGDSAASDLAPADATQPMIANPGDY